MKTVSNWGWIAAIAVHHYPDAGTFMLALAMAHIALDAEATGDILRVFAEHRADHTPMAVVRSEN